MASSSSQSMDENPYDESAFDKFATLFSPPTPRASPSPSPEPSFPPGSSPSSEASAQRRPVPSSPRSSRNRLSYTSEPPLSSASDEFGSFVSVPPTEDPLARSGTSTPVGANALATGTGGRGGAGITAMRPAFSEHSRRVSHDLLNELLLHEDDPMYWLGSTSSQPPPPAMAQREQERRDQDEAKVRETQKSRDEDDNTISGPPHAKPMPVARPSLLADFDPLAPPHSSPSQPTSHRTPARAILRPSPSVSLEPSLSPVSATPPPPRPLTPPPEDFEAHPGSAEPSLAQLASKGGPAQTQTARQASPARPHPPSRSSSTLTAWLQANSRQPSSQSTPPPSSSPFTHAPALSRTTSANHSRETSSDDLASSWVGLGADTRRTGSIFGVASTIASLSPSSYREGVVHKPTPFAAHGASAAPSGAPGFNPDEGKYDWDKGFSEREVEEADLAGVERPGRDSGGQRGEGSAVVRPLKELSPQLAKRSVEEVKLTGRREMTEKVLTGEIAGLIRAHLPALSRLPRAWTLLYSLDQHGASLSTLYNRTDPPGVPPNYAQRGQVVVVKDARGGVFGVFARDGVRMSSTTGLGGSYAYYGGGESFMWRLVSRRTDDRGRAGEDRDVEEREVEVFRWTGRNEYVALCEPGFLSFGGGDGRFGLYLDSGLLNGSTARCPTFDNPPLARPRGKKGAGAAREGKEVKFECVGLEVWGVGNT